MTASIAPGFDDPAIGMWLVDDRRTGRTEDVPPEYSFRLLAAGWRWLARAGAACWPQAARRVSPRPPSIRLRSRLRCRERLRTERRRPSRAPRGTFVAEFPRLAWAQEQHRGQPGRGKNLINHGGYAFAVFISPANLARDSRSEGQAGQTSVRESTETSTTEGTETQRSERKKGLGPDRIRTRLLSDSDSVALCALCGGKRLSNPPAHGPCRER